MIKLHRSWPPLFKILLVMIVLGQWHLRSQWSFQDYQYIHTMRKLLVYAKHSAQAPEYGGFLRTEETMNDAEKGLRHRVIGLQNACLGIQRASSW